MEGLTNCHSIYAPQATIPLFNSSNTFFASVGGTPANNTFKWYLNNTLIATINAGVVLSLLQTMATIG
jgi:hypothetical protein